MVNHQKASGKKHKNEFAKHPSLLTRDTSIPLVAHYPTDSSVDKVVLYKDVDDGMKLVNCEQVETLSERGNGRMKYVKNEEE